MNCPKCPTSLEPVSHGGIDLNACPLCSGIWFDKGELEKFNQFDDAFPLSPGKRPAGKHTRLRCPRCPGLLKETPYAPDVHLEVARCPACEGVWLDADEIETVRRVLEAETKPRGKGLARLMEAAQRERELWARHKAELAQQEARFAERETRDRLSKGEWLFMFLTRLPREVYNPVSGFPKVTVALIVVDVLAFLAVLPVLMGPNAERFLRTYGFVPDTFRQMEHLWAIFTSMFLHGGLIHLLGNMYFLYTFGDNVEDYLGPLHFTALYLLCGIMGTMLYFAADVFSRIPTVGASGAIAGILGAYMVLFSRRKIYVLIVFWPIKLQALWYVGFWIAFQILMALTFTPRGGGGIAWFAHIGGFLTGLAVVGGYRVLRKTQVGVYLP